MTEVIDLTVEGEGRKRKRSPEDDGGEGRAKLVRTDDGTAFDALTRIPTWEEIEARFSEPLLPRNAHPRDDLVRLDTSVDPATGKRRHDYYVRYTPDGEWILKKDSVSASAFHHYFFWPFVKSRKTKISAFALRKRLAKEQGVTLDAVVGAKTDVEIGEEWDATAVHGTERHAEFEKILNGVRLTDEEKKTVPPGFLRCLAAHPTWVPYRTEMSVWHPELNIIGQLDCIMRDTAYPEDDENHWVLLDFKTWRKNTSTKAYGKAWHPTFSQLDDTKVSHASFQTAVYCLTLPLWGLPNIVRRVVWSFPSAAPLEYEEHRMPVVDIMAAFAMLPWDWQSPLHLGVALRDRVCERVLPGQEEKGGAVTVQPYGTGEGPLTSANDVWVSGAWARCVCGGEHKGAKALDSALCKVHDIELPDSPFKWTRYPRGVYGDERMTEEEAHIVALQYEAALIAQPAEMLRRAVRELPGKRLRCWASEMAHAEVLARYVNAVVAGTRTLVRNPNSLEAFILPPEPPKLHCAQCKKWAPLEGTLTYDPRANLLKWRCASMGCQADVSVERRITACY
jgi:hypothetical protein